MVVTRLIALVQHDMKKLIAYSSVAHMAFVTFGLFAFNRQGIEGAMIVMLSHGLVSGALFLCVGVIYDRLHTREIVRYGGLSDNMPKYALLFMIFTMASVGLPGTSGFVGEFLSLVGLYAVSSWAAVVATTGIILGAAYMLYLYWRICYGKLVHADAAAMTDLSGREMWLLAPIAAAVFWMGVYPESFLRPMRADIGRLLERIDRAKPAGDCAPDCRQAGTCHTSSRGSALMNLAPILPELILTVGAIVLMMVAAFMGRRGSALCSWASVALLLVGRGDACWASRRAPGPCSAALIQADGFGAFGKLVIYLCAAVAIVMAHNWFERDFEHAAEYPVLILLSAIGMSVMVSATSLITLYVGLELQSLSAYVLAAYRRTDERSAEAGLKYFVLGGACVGHPALRHFAALRLHRHDPVRRHRRGLHA